MRDRVDFHGRGKTPGSYGATGRNKAGKAKAFNEGR